MPKISERKRIQALEAKLKQLKTLEARKAARARTTAAKKSRGEELRRKILAGAVLLAKVEAGEFEEAVLKQWMSVALTREEDRALFGLALRAPLVGSVPLGEELLFRGLLLDWLKQKVAAWQAVPISSLIFALLHSIISRWAWQAGSNC
jgi:hypothetical protein